MRRNTLAALACLGVLLAGDAVLAQESGETLYVIEQLTVSVNAVADGSGERITQIKSGDRVEVLEHSGDQARIKLASGEEGWVRAAYLSPSRPLREQLKASTDEVEKLRQDKTKLEADLATARKAATAASSAATASATSVAAAAPTSGGVQPAAVISAAGDSAAPASESMPADPMPSNPPLFSDGGIMPSRPSWIFALVAAVVALVAGFTLGWRMLDRRIRAKYGGLRIY